MLLDVIVLDFKVTLNLLPQNINMILKRERERERVNGKVERHRHTVWGVEERESPLLPGSAAERGGSRAEQVSAYSAYHTNYSKIH